MAGSRKEKDKFVVRMPDGMRAALAAAAKANNRSINAEIVFRLGGAHSAPAGLGATESGVTDHLIAQLSSRAARGVQKYGVTLDRDDLGAGDWLQHFIEELLDAAGYAEALRRNLSSARGAA